MKLTMHPDASAFLRAVEGALKRDEAKNNLILGIAGRLRAGGHYGLEPPYFLSIKEGRELVVAAIRTPPYPLILHAERVCHDALGLLADHLVLVDRGLPGVHGERGAAAAFAACWSSRAHARAKVEKRLRIYVLREVLPPTDVPGTVRVAEAHDIELLAGWFSAFRSEVFPGDPPVDAREALGRFMTNGTLAVWEDGGPVSMAGSSRASERGAAVSAVYTPPGLRGRGYASACVASLSRMLLDGGYAFCTLYADLTNPTSNKIYQRIGYRPAGDAVAYRFKPDDERAAR